MAGPTSASASKTAGPRSGRLTEGAWSAWCMRDPLLSCEHRAGMFRSDACPQPYAAVTIRGTSSDTDESLDRRGRYSPS